ncbi:MAG: bifunctional phosphopantothenoylcysteine decarboxylase/phosphopantothenate--cysteine ligase CoaBC, partial [Thaumarchaeota archaeon]|nr:bifunctional phosphopantothenoylcysteine decarboxylase/phosphopantothenate--cysteine ligase CoaBC [Nitrososphaerota archaeon]
KDKVQFISPQFVEGKAKAAEPEKILDFILKKYGASSVLQGKKVLITAGPTIEYIDPVRVITNQSTGRTGVLLARELVSSGTKVTFVYGPGTEHAPKGAKVVRVKTSREMLEAVRHEMRQRFDIVVLAAAVSDYTVENPSKTKVKSDPDKMIIQLRKVPKIINEIKKIQKSVFLVGFKAETDVSKEKLIALSRKKLQESRADVIIANDIGKKYRKNPEKNNVVVVDSKKESVSGWKDKEKIARFVCREIEHRFRKFA